MKNKALGFSLAGSLLIILFMLFINYTTSPGFPWFVYPVFAVLWWPLGVYTAQRGGVKFITVTGSLLTIVFFIIVNLTTSPGFLWCIFPIFGVIWWPMSVLIGRGHAKLYSILGFALITGFFLIINLVTSPQYLWFIHIAYPAVWWPLSVFLAKKKTIRVYSLIASLLTIAYFAGTNLSLTPENLWFLYIVFPLILWPALMYTKKQAGSLPVAIIGSLTGITYYMVLNIFMSAGHPWILYLVLPFVWWPVTIMFGKATKKIAFLFISVSVFMLYYSLLNIFVSPGYPWSLYLLYPYAWAVIGMYFGLRRKGFALSIAATLITAVFVSIMNLVLTPNTIWAVFPIFTILWWPMSLYFFKIRNRKQQSVA